MYGYVREGERAGVTRQRIGGVWFAVATVPPSGLLAGYRRGRVLRKLRRQGIRTCVLPSALTAEAARWGLREMPVQELRLALLPQLLDILQVYGLPTEVPYPLADIQRTAEADKKRSGSDTNFVVPKALGRCRVEPIPADEVAGWLKAGGIR